MFLKNAEANFRKAGVKELHAKRRKRLDEEHGVNRDKMREDFEQLDKMFRITEKEEIAKYQQIGKTAKDYYQQQMETAAEEGGSSEGTGQPNEGTASGSVIEKQLATTEDGMKVQYIKSEGYEQVSVTPTIDNPDPRVGGSKIIFDSRLDKFSTAQ